MPLSDVLFQNRAHDRLQRALQGDRLPHAYVFAGPQGVGKEMLASRLAAALLCSNPQKAAPPKDFSGRLDAWIDACGRCDDCRLSAAGTHPDYHPIHRTLNKYHPEKKVQIRKAVELGIDVIRHFLIDKIGLRPSRGRAKVFVVLEAERLSTAAQNAMLKTLEEPPGHSYLVLLAASADALLETTKSRCHLISFRSLPSDFVRNHLVREAGLPERDATFLAELSQGSPGRAKLLAACRLHEQVSQLLDVIDRTAPDPLGSGNALMEASKQLADQLKTQTRADEGDTNLARSAQAMILAAVATILRDVQRAAVGHPPAALPTDKRIDGLATKTDSEAIRNAIRAVGTAEFQIDRNVNAGLIFDTLGIALGGAFDASRTPAPMS